MTRTADTAPSPARLARRTPAVYDRAAWERAVMASGMHTSARLIALILAHHAGDRGVIPAGGPQDARLLAKDSGIEGKFVRISLTRLERSHFLTRPPIETWDETKGVRPVVLTIPARRERPPHPGERP
ncbi:hypothetical protein [Streptomyces scabiei]|uniref:hypothetical protein n=1 Tax=Streptomyces scabiei TaxID=1930 RepID=UPI0029AAE55A|nr:hypothetical protein [Streptomyces scabiei]MDX3033023.1 hypothetical protein [Streptomyces scabiei]